MRVAAGVRGGEDLRSAPLDPHPETVISSCPGCRAGMEKEGGPQGSCGPRRDVLGLPGQRNRRLLWERGTHRLPPSGAIKKAQVHAWARSTWGRIRTHRRRNAFHG